MPIPSLEGVRDLVAVMDRLRSPGGCAWDAAQTHETLAAYAVEEVFELVDALAGADRGHVREELGDLLLQVVFHARIAQEHAEDAYDLDDVAATIATKLRRRHPHVFGDLDPAQTDIAANWERLKAAEKPHRSGPLDGVPTGLPPLERAMKVVDRLDRGGLGQLVTDRLAAVDAPAGAQRADGAEGQDLGEQLFALVARAVRAGQDPALELRRTLTDLEGTIGRAGGRA